MSFFKKIDIGYIGLGFLAGIILCYFIDPSEKMVTHYPNIYNTESSYYTDSGNNCYKFREKRVACSRNAIQHSLTSQ